MSRLTAAAGAAMFFTLGLSAPQALAQWTAKAEAGAVSARGNTTTESANAKFSLGKEFVSWKHTGGLTGVYASDEVGATTQRWDARGQTEYKFHEKGFSFVSARYEEDRFSGFEFQTTYGAGLGWRFFNDTETKLIAQLGAGYRVLLTRESLAEDGLSILPREREKSLIVQGQVEFERALTETTRVLNKLLVEHGEDNTFVQNDLSLQVKILGSLALAVGYSVRYNTKPPPDFTTTDTLTTLNLVYELK